MKKILFPITLAFFVLSCVSPSQTEKELQAVLNTTIQFGKLDTIQDMRSLLTLQQLLDNYEYKSIVYLQDGCEPCYPKFIKWHQKMDSIACPDNFSVLFVIHGNSYEDFMINVLNVDHVDDNYYTIMDPEFQFLAANKDIPRWIIEASVLIDSENKIKMVGAPWINEDMTKLFYEIVSKGKS
jgi:hypothetical protein